MQHLQSRLFALVSLIAVCWQQCSTRLVMLRTLLVALVLLFLIGMTLLLPTASSARQMAGPMNPPPGCGAAPCIPHF